MIVGYRVAAVVIDGNIITKETLTKWGAYRFARKQLENPNVLKASISYITLTNGIIQFDTLS